MYKLSNLAADDFRQIDRYSRTRFGDRQADSYVEEMAQCLRRLAALPLSGREQNAIKPGLRRWDYQRHSIFYLIREKDIFILRILHQKRDIAQQFTAR